MFIKAFQPRDLEVAFAHTFSREAIRVMHTSINYKLHDNVLTAFFRYAKMAPYVIYIIVCIGNLTTKLREYET